MQHPLHYPHGTLFMAPGPAGQTAAIPSDKGLRRLMLREWHNYNVIFSSYNFDFKPASDSLMAKAMRWWDKQQALRKREEALEAKIADQQMRRYVLTMLLRTHVYVLITAVPENWTPVPTANVCEKLYLKLSAVNMPQPHRVM